MLNHSYKNDFSYVNVEPRTPTLKFLYVTAEFG